jgi:hypothetical protein
VGISSQKMTALADQVKGLAARVHDKVNGPIGIATIRAFLRGKPDPGAHLGPPKPSTPPSMRWLLFGQSNETPDDDEQS